MARLTTCLEYEGRDENPIERYLHGAISRARPGVMAVAADAINLATLDRSWELWKKQVTS